MKSDTSNCLKSYCLLEIFKAGLFESDTKKNLKLMWKSLRFRDISQVTNFSRIAYFFFINMQTNGQTVGGTGSCINIGINNEPLIKWAKLESHAEIYKNY